MRSTRKAARKRYAYSSVWTVKKTLKSPPPVLGSETMTRTFTEISEQTGGYYFLSGIGSNPAESDPPSRNSLTSS